MPKLLAVEADEHASQLLTHAVAPHKNWKASHALVNNTKGQATWHSLSHSEESGLTPANTLSALWPNITEQQQTQRSTVPLSDLLELTDEGQEHYNWLTIDCLPAAQLLQGLNSATATLDMIEVRVAVSDLTPEQSGTTVQECDAILGTCQPDSDSQLIS